MRTSRHAQLAFLLVTFCTLPALAQAPDADVQKGLASARQLYTSADYTGTLDSLDRLAAANPSPHDRQSIDLYRTLCLVALGKTELADAMMTAMITREPLYRPDDSELSPRLRVMFHDARTRLLPTVIQAKYDQARAHFDRKEYESAAEGFTIVLTVLADPEMAGPASRSPLADLRIIANGFNDLALKAIAPPPAPVPPPVLPAAPATQRTITPQPPKIYDTSNTDVVPPVAVKQDMPRYASPVPVEKTGEIFIVVSESGSVESAIITSPVDRIYDRLLLAATKGWTYKPATLDGMAVKFRKRIQLTLPRQGN